MSDQHNIHGVPDGDVEADTASGGAPEPADKSAEDQAAPDELDELRTDAGNPNHDRAHLLDQPPAQVEADDS